MVSGHVAALDYRSGFLFSRGLVLTLSGNAVDYLAIVLVDAAYDLLIHLLALTAEAVAK